MDYLSRLLQLTSEKKGFKFHPSCRKLGLTHLMFADDLVLFSKADPVTLHYIMSALHIFHDCAGLKVNMTKSQMVLGGCNAAMQDQCIKITGFHDSSFPLKYLGVPITASRLTKSECSELVEKIQAKVRIWATRSLSFVGRVRLINSVIFGVYAYWPPFSCSLKRYLTSLPKYVVTTSGEVQRNTNVLPTFPGQPHVYLKVKGD